MSTATATATATTTSSSTTTLDYLELCRLCLVKERANVPIFEDEGDVRQIFLKIAACLPVKVSRDDKLPKKICDDCVYKVELFYQFWNTTANAEKQLLEWLGDVGGLEDKEFDVLDTNVMKQEGRDNRLDGSVMQISGHQNNMEIGIIDNMSIIQMPDGSEQFTAVPMDASTTIQVVGSSTQVTHDQSQVAHIEEVESEIEDNSDDGCDNEEGLPVKEETEEEQASRAMETQFVTISGDQAGPSGLQQQKMKETQRNADDPKTHDCIEDLPEGTFTALNELDILRIKQDLIDSLVNDDIDRICQYCGESFLYVNRLVNHLQIVHGVERPFQCPHCEKSYPQRFMLNNHVKRAHKALIICAHCGFGTVERAKLERHIKRMHENQTPSGRSLRDFYTQAKSYLNDLSGFIDKSEIPRRPPGRPRKGRQPRKERTYLCADCGIVLKTYKGLKIHTRGHTGEKPYSCAFCDKTFTCETLLRTHRVTHTGEKPFKCDICDKRFTQRSTLTVHKRYHSGERPYSCDRCNKGFVTRTLLNTHRRNCFLDDD